VLFAELNSIHRPSSPLLVESGSNIILSDPRIPTVLHVYRQSSCGQKKAEPNFVASVTTPDRVRVVKKDHLVYLSSLAMTNTGGIEVTIAAGDEVVTQHFSFRVPETDRDRDGYPDVVELGDHAGFREWFCAIADSQFYYPADTWYAIYQNCSGLVEFAFREALKRHDQAWAAAYPYLSDFSIPDERPYYYPAVPFLGERLFRTTAGPFSAHTVADDFAAFVHGTVLRHHSMVFVSKQLDAAKKGDLLCFFHPDNLQMPAHIMIYLGNASMLSAEENFVIYHTGPGAQSKGILKKVRLSDLLKHPDPTWRPTPQNPSFLGVYRWKILD
jgi:uncharacterized protein YfaT (DUF1175 family)